MKPLGPKLLAEALHKRGLSSVDFAPRCDVTPTAVVRWLDGSRCPRRAQRARIEVLLDGEVSRFSWLNEKDAELEKTREAWLAKTQPPVPMAAMAAKYQR